MVQCSGQISSSDLQAEHWADYHNQFYSGFGTLFPDDEYIAIVEFGVGLAPNRLVATTLTNPSLGYG